MDNATSDSKGTNSEVMDKLSTGLSANLKTCDENPTNTEHDVYKIFVEDYYNELEEHGLSEDALLAQIGYVKSDEEEEDEENDFSEEEILAQMGYAETNPKRKTVNDAIEESFLTHMSCLKKELPKHEPITTPTSELNLVSALKGSREKEGISAKERRVSWDPDVYDPYPTYAELLVASKNEGDRDNIKIRGSGGKNKQKSSGRKAVGWEVEGGEVKGKRGGGSKWGVEKGKNKDKKKGKKRGGGGGSASKKNSEFGEF